jgi:hypothetical protein
MFSSRQTLTLVLLACGVVASAFAKPNFGGEWQLNIAKSNFGEMPAPKSRTDKITHADPDLKVAVSMSGSQGDFSFDLNYLTDGKETTAEFGGNPMKSIAKWDGDTLFIETRGSFGGNDFTMRDQWTLSADGKTLTIERHFASSQGEGTQKMVLEKK